MNEDLDKLRVQTLLHIDDTRIAIESALALIEDPLARNHLERAKRSLENLDKLSSIAVAKAPEGS